MPASKSDPSSRGQRSAVPAAFPLSYREPNGLVPQAQKHLMSGPVKVTLLSKRFFVNMIQLKILSSKDDPEVSRQAQTIKKRFRKGTEGIYCTVRGQKGVARMQEEGSQQLGEERNQ